MVMDKMREHTKIFLIILVVAFVGTIIFSWGMDITGIRQQPNVVGKVNNEKIMAKQYYQAVQNQIKQQREQGDAELTDQQIDQIENRVWESLVQEILMRQEIEERGIAATDSEVVYVVKNNPPQIIRQNESFQTEGTFDMQKYKKALQNPQNDWRPVENYVRNLIPFQKLQQRITASVIATPEEVHWEYIKRNEKAKVNYIFFDPTDYSDDQVTVSETEIKLYYEKNKQQYHEPEKRKIEYVLFPVKPTPRDSQLVMDDTMDLLERIKEGEDFASLAESYSEDPGSRKKGGDLGYFERGTMAKPFEEAAFAANEGEVIGPVESSFGVHIIKVEDKKTENGKQKVKARHILLKYVASSETRDDIRTNATLFAMDAIEQGLETAAKTGDTLEVKQTPFFADKSFIPGLGYSREISKFVFNGEEGEITEEPIETNQGFVVAEISDIQKEHTKPLSEVQNSIRKQLIREKKKELAGQKAAHIRSQINQSNHFEQVAIEDSLELNTTEFFTRDDYIPQVGKDPDFIGTVFGLELNQISQPVESTRGYYLIKLIDQKRPDESNFKNKKEMLRQQILARKKQQAFTNWYTNLKKEANIEDYRQRNI